MLRSRIALLAVAVLALTACGGGDEVATPSPTTATSTAEAPATTPPAETEADAPVAAGGDLVSAFAASIMESQAATGADLDELGIAYSEEEATCIAQQVVDGVGEDALREYGIIDADGNVTQETDVTFTEEDANVVADGIVGCSDVLETMRTTMAEQLGGDDAMGTCIQDAVDDDLVRSMLVASLSDQDDQAMGPLMAAAMGCLGENMTDLPTEIPTGLLDELPTEG